MNKNYQTVLKDAGIRPSIQRIAIYSYLCEHHTHPDVEEIFAELSPLYPTLSKTTIYNTLQLFTENHLIQAIKIDNDKIRYDAEMSDHLHFKCDKCGNIFDIYEGSNITALFKECEKQLPEGFVMRRIETDIWGTCPACNKKQ